MQFIDNAFLVISSLNSAHHVSLPIVFADKSLTERAETVDPNQTIDSSEGNELEVINSTLLLF